MSRLVHVDARHPPARPDQDAVVISAYCADSATDDLAEWEQFMHAIMAHVAPGGLFATAALHRSHGYTVGGRTFPSADVDMDDMVHVVDNAWGPGIVVAQVRQLTDQTAHGYDGIILATAVRPDERGQPSHLDHTASQHAHEREIGRPLGARGHQSCGERRTPAGSSCGHFEGGAVLLSS